MNLLNEIDQKMKRKFILGLIVLCSFVTVARAQESNVENDVPDWVTKEHDVWVEEGIIYARGSARMSMMVMSINMSATRARSNLLNALANNLISGYSTLPVDTKEPTTFTVNGISGTLGDIATISIFTTENGTVFTLISCAGAEVTQ